jgi:O-antigen ligase
MLKQNLGELDISLFFIGLMFFLPFIIMHHALPIPSFYTEWFAALSGFIAISPLLRTTIWKNIKIPQISLVFLALATILVIQWFGGILQSTQFFLLLLSYLIWAFFLTILGSHLRRELGWERLVTTLAWGLIAAGIVNFIILALQLLVKSGGIVPFLPNLVSFGAISQPNHLANFDALAIASLVYLYAKQRLSQSFFILLLLLFIIILSFSGSRSAWLYLSAFAILAIALHINTIKQDASSEVCRRVLGVGLLILPTFAIVQMIIHHVIPNQYVNLPIERLMDGVAVQSPSARLHIWYDSLRIFIQSPWLGIGMGQIRESAFSLLNHPSAMASNIVFEHTHNLFLHLLTEMGIFAALFVLVGLVIL